jgi:hypothetical protein
MVLISRDSEKPRGTFFVVLAATEEDFYKPFAGVACSSAFKNQGPVLMSASWDAYLPSDAWGG